MSHRGTLPLLALVTTGLSGAILGGCSGGSESLNAPLSHASSIAVDATDVYWFAKDSQIVRRSKSGGPVVAVATEPCHALLDIALDDEYVYWSIGYSSASCPTGVSRAPKVGGSAVKLATDMLGGQGIVLDDQFVYLVGDLVANGPLFDGSSASRTKVYAVPKAGGAPNAIAGPRARGAPAVGGRNVYWVADLTQAGATTTTAAIMRTDSRGTSTKLATLSENVVRLAFYGDRIYWAASGFSGPNGFCALDCDTPANVKSMGPGDPAPVNEITLAKGALIDDLVIDSRGIWVFIEGTCSGIVVDYCTVDDHTGSVLHVLPDGSSSTVLTGLRQGSDLALDEASVFGEGDTEPFTVAQ
jgi:hypothetical protein